MKLNFKQAAFISLVLLFSFWSFFRVAADQGFGIALNEEFASIENKGLKIKFAKNNGQIQSLLDKETGLELWSNEADNPLFTLVLTKPAEAKIILVTSVEFKKVQFESSQSDNTQTLTITFSHSWKADLEAACKFSIDKENRLISARLKVENQSPWAIKVAMFPSIALKKQIGDSGEDDRLLFPGSGGELFKNPGALKMKAQAYHPGWASYQMQAYYDGKAGLYLATQDIHGEVKLFGGNSRSMSMDMTPMHMRPEIIGGDFEDVYAVVVAPIRAPWYNAADLYKEWAKEQFWCENTLAQRDDIPGWLKTGPAVLMANSKLEQVGAMNYKDDLDGLLDNLEHYRKTAGTRHLILSTMGWEHQGSWVGIKYFPSKPSEAWWKELKLKGKDKGIHTTFMTNGYKWTIKRFAYDFGAKYESGPAVDNTKEWQENLHMVITKANGKPMYNDGNYAPGSWIGAFSKICRGTGEGRQVITDIFEHLAKEMGASSASFDQEIGGGEFYPCYAPDHDHPPGFGRWMSEGYSDNLNDILKSARKHVKDFFVYQENEGEYTIPYQATSWARNYHIYGHPHQYAWGVPVYPYLYHEYITSIGGALHFGMGQFLNVGPGRAPIEAKTRAYATARNLAFGQLQGDRTAEILLNEEGRPEGLVSRAYFNFTRPISDHADFLVLGKMKRPFPLTSPKTDIILHTSPYPAFGKKTASNPMTAVLPAVLQGVYESPNGKVGVILVNATDMAQEAEIKFTGEYAARATDVYEYRKGEKVATHKSGKGMSLKLHFDRLEPVFLLLD